MKRETIKVGVKIKLKPHLRTVQPVVIDGRCTEAASQPLQTYVIRKVSDSLTIQLATEDRLKDFPFWYNPNDFMLASEVDPVISN